MLCQWCSARKCKWGIRLWPVEDKQGRKQANCFGCGEKKTKRDKCPKRQGTHEGERALGIPRCHAFPRQGAVAETIAENTRKVVRGRPLRTRFSYFLRPFSPCIASVGRNVLPPSLARGRKKKRSLSRAGGKTHQRPPPYLAY